MEYYLNQNLEDGDHVFVPLVNGNFFMVNFIKSNNFNPKIWMEIKK